MRRSLCLVLLAACGGNNSGNIDAPSGTQHDAPNQQHDAPNQIDAPGQQIDAAIDGAITVDGPPAMGTKHYYVADSELVPTTNSQALMYGLDLDGDGQVDNQFGKVMATFASQGGGFGGQTAVTTAIDRGTTIILPMLETTDFTTATAAGFTVYQGSNPQPPACSGPTDTTCRHHLTGTASFTVPAGSPHDPLLVGDFVAGTLTTPIGNGTLPMFLPLGNGSVLSVDLIGARTQVTAASATGLTAILAGAISQNDINMKVYPALQAAFMAQVSANCTGQNPPTCGCTNGSAGAQTLALFDMNHDCTISVQEIASNSLIASLFAPDVTINGVPGISVGVKITAVGATFTP